MLLRLAVLGELEVEAMQEMLHCRRQQHGGHRQEEKAAEDSIEIANTFAGADTTAFTGPMPVRIMAALSAASSHGRPSR